MNGMKLIAAAAWAAWRHGGDGNRRSAGGGLDGRAIGGGRGGRAAA